MATRKKKHSSQAEATPWKRVARPDAIDFRDRWFRPNVAVSPAPTLFPAFQAQIKNQGDTNACTGFALSVVVESLLARAKRLERGKVPVISPYMLYSMARRYDEFPGSVEDEGSSARGALKGWFKHGACALDLFAELEMPPAQPPEKIGKDWWFDAVKRPLGAYYRIEPKNIIDIHAALNEVGVVYVTCGCHSGWDEGVNQPYLPKRPASFKNLWVIPRQAGQAEHAGHAFVLVGYNERGFLIQNSWGPEWGSHGYALLTYDDWIDNAMDCWVAQLGVVTSEHEELSRTPSLRTEAVGRGIGHVVLSGSTVLRNREIAPFIINMGNNGKLSNSGQFRTTPDDVRAIVDVHLKQARARWKRKNQPIDVCLYAHGGLVGEEQAAGIAAKWIAPLYDRQIFPVFLMWETDFWSTLLGRLEDAVRGIPRAAGAGMLDGVQRWWNQRVERLLARPGHLLWHEMKQNAQALSAYSPTLADDQQTGLSQLYIHFRQCAAEQPVRLHFVGHSCGAIVAAWALQRMVELSAAHGAIVPFASMSFMAPALTVADFDHLVRPHLVSRKLGRYQQFHLSDRAESDDRSCGPYRRSMLYLVSESFEAGSRVPLVGMQRYWDAMPRPPRAAAHVAPGPVCECSTHVGFDEDTAVQQAVMDFILKQL
jgi:hypothetical protein